MIPVPMSYLLVVDPSCHTVGCTKRSTTMVFDSLDNHVGCFCARHGKRVLERLHRSESESRAA